MLPMATLAHRALSDLVNMRTNNPVLGAQAQVCVICPPDRSNRAPILARPPTSLFLRTLLLTLIR